jgi:lysophospholipase L1-like esterase
MFSRALLFTLLFVSSAFAVDAPKKSTPPPGPERWEKDIAAYEAKDKANPPEKGGIVFVGSSSVRLWTTLGEDFPHHRVLNRGFGGSQISDSVHFAHRIVIPYAPRMVVMYAGGNDINAKKTPAAVFGDFQAFVKKVRAALPDTEIAFISVAPNPKRWAQIEEVKALNKMVADYCAATPKLKFIDVFPHMLGPDGLPKPDIYRDDKLHMVDKGYRIWADLVGKHLPPPDKP